MELREYVHEPSESPPDDHEYTDDDAPNAPPRSDTAPKGDGGPVIMPSALRCTDTGNAKRIVARYRDRIRYCPQRRCWFTWDSRRWLRDERGLIVEFAKASAAGIFDEAKACKDAEVQKAIAKWACKSEEHSRLKAAIALAQSEPGIAVLAHELDADPWAFNVLNGTIDLRTGKLRPHRREDLITKLSPVEYDTGARSELWERYLRDATGGDDELAAYLQRAVGYALQGTTSEKAFWFLFGPPNGTKSTFIRAIGGAFGEYHVPASFETWLVQTNTGGNRGDLVRLMGARLVSSVEVRRGARFDESILKAVTGDDAITAAAKYETEVTFYAAFALWLAANDAPTIRDDDEGAWSRVRRVPFINAIPKEKQDPTMRARLLEPSARAAVLAWAVTGCLEWQKHGLGTCQAVESSTNEYRADMDRVAGFFAERCRFEDSAKAQRSAFRTAYEEWCKDAGVKTPLTGKEIAARLREKGVSDGKSDGKRVWKGVRLLETWEEPDEPLRDTGDRKGQHSQEILSRKRHQTLSGGSEATCPCDPEDGSRFDSNQGSPEPETQSEWSFRS